MDALDEMYEGAARRVLSTEDGREFFAYILRKLGFERATENAGDAAVRNAAVGLLEGMMDVAGIRVDVLKIH
jgi:hypothetical protein